MTDKEKLEAAITFIRQTLPYQLGGDISTATDIVIKAAQAHSDRFRCEREAFKEASWIGQHVQRGFIAFGSEMYSPEFYEIKEKTHTTENDDK